MPDYCFIKCVVIFVISVAFIASLIALIFNTKWENEWQSFKEHECNITSIDRPMEIYSQNNTVGWSQCSCNSINGVSACIKLHTNVKESKIIQPDYGDVKECTKTTDCACGQLSLNTEFSTINDTYMEYINQTVKCYYDTGVTMIYLKKSSQGYRENMILSAVIFTLVIFGTTCYVGCYYYEKHLAKHEYERKARRSISYYTAINKETFTFAQHSFNESIYSGYSLPAIEEKGYERVETDPISIESII